jgi:hypothetical protein
VWRPDARQATASFLDEHAEDLAAELLEEDTLVRLGRPRQPAAGASRARERLEQGLRAVGFVVRPWKPLDAWYDGSDINPPEGLRAAYDDPDALVDQLTRADQPSTDSRPGIVLTAVSIDGQQVLAVPREVAAAELRTAALLAKASTFGEVRQDADAAAVVEPHMDEYRQRLLDEADWPEEEDDEEVLARLTGDTGDYHGPHFFSDDDQLEWQAYAEVRAPRRAGWPSRSRRCSSGMTATTTATARCTRRPLDRGGRPRRLRGRPPGGGLHRATARLDTLHQLYLDPPLDVENVLDHGEHR